MVCRGGVTPFITALGDTHPSDVTVRPKAVEITLRRLVVKVASRQAIETCRDYLQPRQLGVGAKEGCEVAVHSAIELIFLPCHLIGPWVNLIIKMPSIASVKIVCWRRFSYTFQTSCTLFNRLTLKVLFSASVIS